MIILAIFGLLALGVMIGGIIGGIFTGDWRYTITWAVAMSVVIVWFIFGAMSLARRAVAGTDGAKRPRAARTVIACVLVLATATVTLIPAFGTIARIGTDQSPLTGAYQAQDVDAISQVVGSHELIDVDFYDSYIIVEAPTRPGADTTDDYQFRYGHAERLGPEMMQPENTKVAQYDGRTVDWALIPKLINDAERRAHITHPDSLHVSVMQSLDPRSGHAPTINVNVEDAYHDAFVQYSPHGKYLTESGSAFDLG